MHSTINIGETQEIDKNVHLVPCCIRHNGPASVSTYFKPLENGWQWFCILRFFENKPIYMRSCLLEQKVLEAYFRGRKLLGLPLNLPGNYKGAKR